MPPPPPALPTHGRPSQAVDRVGDATSEVGGHRGIRPVRAVHRSALVDPPLVAAAHETGKGKGRGVAPQTPLYLGVPGRGSRSGLRATPGQVRPSRDRHIGAPSERAGRRRREPPARPFGCASCAPSLNSALAPAIPGSATASVAAHVAPAAFARPAPTESRALRSGPRPDPAPGPPPRTSDPARPSARTPPRPRPRRPRP